MTSTCSIYFLDVGQGDCSVIWAPSNEVVLVDCRSSEVAHHFCDDNGIKHLSAVIVSHLDQDHIQGMVGFLENFMTSGGTVGTIFVDKDRPHVGVNGTSLMKCFSSWHKQGKLRLRPTFTEHEPRIVAAGSNWRIQIVWPTYERHFESYTNRRHEPNSLSSIVQIRCYGRTVTVGADAPLSAWDKVLPAELLKSDVVRAPHHGGNILVGTYRWATVDAFYQEIAANAAVFSVGTNNRDSHPLPQHIHAARRMGSCQPLCTQLTRQCHNDLSSIRSLAIRNIIDARIALPYRHDEADSEVPCAGSVMVRISPGGQIETFPSPKDWHDDFISNHVQHPLCRQA